MPTRSVKSAWLVTWEWAGDHARVDEEKQFVTVFNYRWSSERVRELVEQLYITLEYTPWDKAAAAKSKNANPYPGEVVAHGEIHCGHNPWLRARRVRNFQVVTNGDGTHKLRWDELPRRSAQRASAAE